MALQLWICGKDIGHHGGDGFGEGCLSFLLLVGIRGFLSITNRSVPVVRHSTLVTPHLSFHTCHSLFVTLSVMVPFLFSPWQEVRRVWKLLLMLAPWRAVILLCICMQLTSHCPEAVCPLRCWTSVCLGQQLCTGAHVKWVTKKCVIHVRPRSAKSGDYWLPKNPSLNWERCLYSWSREVLLLDKE